MTPIERLQRPTSSFRQMSQPRSSFVVDAKGGRKSIPLVINHPMPNYQYAGFDTGDPVGGRVVGVPTDLDTLRGRLISAVQAPLPLELHAKQSQGVMRIFKISDAATIDHVKAADADVQAAYDALKVADESALGSLQKRLNDANAAINTAVVTAHVAKHAVDAAPHDD